MEAYIKAVAKELQNIKKKIPLGRRERLKVEHFSPMSQNLCIYGLMYGNCFSFGASKAIKECAVKFIDTLSFYKEYKILPRYKNLQNISERRISFTVLEHGIIHAKYNKDQLLKFLKDEVDTVTLEFYKHKVILNKDTYEIQKI
jgi:inhibitor of KinA sporulation pathway (predicted exonuclease)